MTVGIRSLIGLASFRPVQTFQCSTPNRNTRREPKSSFGENQLLPGSISFSLLTTGHPKESHDQPVRASISLSTDFTLPMASSPGFGSNVYDRDFPASRKITHALLTLAFTTPLWVYHLGKPHTLTRWLILQ